MTNLILVLTAFAVLAAVETVYYLFRYTGEQQRARLRQRLRSIDEPGQLKLLRERRVARSVGADRLLRALPFTDDIEALLLQTDLEWTVASMLTTSTMLAVVLGGGLLALAPTQPLFGILAAPFGFGIPLLIVLSARERRSAKLSEQIPDALDLVVRSLRAGHGLMSGFKLVATEMPLPVAVEFGRCFEEQNAGLDFRDAVTNMTRRVPKNLDLKIMAVSVVVQHETGGNLVEILEKIATTVRERFKFQGKLRALTAEGRISGLILGSLPILSGTGALILNPTYMSTLITDPIGRAILLAAIFLWGFGLLAMRWLAQVEY